MSIGTFYAWKAKFGGMSVNEAQRLRALEEQVRRLETLVADQALDNQMLRSVIEKKVKSYDAARRGKTASRTVFGQRATRLSTSWPASPHASL